MARSIPCAAVLAYLAEAGSAPNYDLMWNDFKNKYNKNYNDLKEPQRFDAFKKNVDYIYDINAKGLSFTLGVNEFADMPNEEFASTYMGYQEPDSMWEEMPNLGNHTYSGEELASAIDWTAQGAVTPVKNQGQCGSCWAFSTTGALEGAWQIATKKLVPLSEQQFVDCDWGDMGCHGGLMPRAFHYATNNKICTEDSYGYEARADWFCYTSKCTAGIPQGGVKGYKNVAEDNMQAMMSAVSKGPVSIAIEADQGSFQLYHGGVLSAECGDQLDHGVLLVGYGTDGKDYWKVKNSWGASWGESGYIRLQRGKGGSGECGLLKSASYPVVQASAMQSEVVV